HIHWVFAVQTCGEAILFTVFAVQAIYSCRNITVYAIILVFESYIVTVEMDRLPGIFYYKDEAYVIHLHRGMTLDDIVSDVCKRWTLSTEKVELKCRIPEQYNSKLTMTSGEDVDRMIDMHAMLNSRIMNVEVHVSSPQDVLTIRPSSALSSGSASNVLALEVNSSQDGSNRSELWYEIIHSVGQTFNSVEHVRSELTKFAIARGFDYIFVKNDLTRVTVKCKVAK
ncbi:hypothetical protein Taro_017845, partial [Colocasia esculenta]|nr:hypothetical protein [Colocasia esculenta]